MYDINYQKNISNMLSELSKLWTIFILYIYLQVCFYFVKYVLIACKLQFVNHYNYCVLILYVVNFHQ